jgi:archaemetzincin
MASLELITVAFDESFLLPDITPSLSELSNFTTSVTFGKTSIIEFYASDRGQYNGAQILEKIETGVDAEKGLIYTSVDLYIPIFTFVFGLAKLNGRLGIVSTCRLRPEFYGLPPDENRLKERLIKESVHELGHLLNLRHCADYRCVMSSSNTADELDVKGAEYCIACADLIRKTQSYAGT